MQYLGISTSELEAKGAIHTAKEISQQPVLWEKIYAQFLQEAPALHAFFQKSGGFKRVIITGAGTSAYIGLSLRGAFQRTLHVLTEALSTTDLVSHPKDYFIHDVPTLLISFARSGNSPESVAAVTLADEFCKTCHHLIITCNPEGLLARHTVRGNKYVFCLPSEANDKSLAMTSSYSGMLLVGKLIAHLDSLDQLAKSVSVITNYGHKSIQYFATEIQQLANVDFKRAVFLGAGPFFGSATEAHLKLQELTDGQVICKNDSFLGFRHGPKAVIDTTTLVVYLFSNNAYSLQYERDLVASMKKGHQPLLEVSISESRVEGIDLQHSFTFSENGFRVDEEFMAIASIIPAQLLAFYKSLQLGLTPDSPSVSGAITRVVEGVNIYTIH
jgi:tagatose-6-phosphate ketose/aldose isomerase